MKVWRPSATAPPWLPSRVRRARIALYMRMHLRVHCSEPRVIERGAVGGRRSTSSSRVFLEEDTFVLKATVSRKAVRAASSRNLNCISMEPRAGTRPAGRYAATGCHVHAGEAPPLPSLSAGRATTSRQPQRRVCKCACSFRHTKAPASPLLRVLAWLVLCCSRHLQLCLRN